MILIGQFDSPFVRRVGIALRLYGLDVEHRPWSTFGDADRLAAFNPLRRVPTLVLEDGEVLLESGAILDHLDETVGPGRALIARAGPERRRDLRRCALATGLADKAVSLVYERVLHDPPSEAWITRCRAQITDVLAVLEAERATCPAPFWRGDSPGHADIALACVLRFLGEAQAGTPAFAPGPALSAHAARCEALDAFRAVQQTFVPPR
ncbi:glutathione S-transferase family protein [Roseomonas sp. OT10]|uniref:glutathione S-transferase family protein n=1 Tax=Roseomonas cutis TaxID=2897332 RepID=UPI001E594620|nr:glutathione S-transferase family protein [Roseomonas sp. OT10]UFN50609.1 glutathione S-transferase family protein [Roseomonas sp. OT10]